MPNDDVGRRLGRAELVALRAGIGHSLEILDEILATTRSPDVRAAAQEARDRAARNLARIAYRLATASSPEVGP